MKFINLFAILFAALIFAGCASTDDTAAASSAAPTADSTATMKSQTSDTQGLLMDRYKSGEIPGYRK